MYDCNCMQLYKKKKEKRKMLVEYKEQEEITITDANGSLTSVIANTNMYTHTYIHRQIYKIFTISATNMDT